MTQTILDQVLASPSLPSMPYVALKVVELTQREDVSVKEITQVISRDPALTAKLLQSANSPLFGLSKKVGSLEQATMTLGLRAVKVMALSFSLVESLRESETTDFDYRKYWRRSLTTAVAAQLISKEHKQCRKDECFVGGLLSDIGMLAARRCVPDLYAAVMSEFASTHRPIQEIEAEILGITHAQISSAMLRRWSLPDVLCDALAAHHGEGFDELLQTPRMTAAVLRAASSIAEVFCGDVEGTRLDEVKADCLALLPISPDTFERILDDVHANVTDTAALFQVEIGETISYEALRMQAMTQLASISLSAERDREQAINRAEEAQQLLVEVSHRAVTDGLTGLANRRAFDEHLEQALVHARQAGGSLGLILIDLDHFKNLNDTYGHQAGDEALRLVGRCLKSICREPTVAARYGGEEFAVTVVDANARATQGLAEQIRQEIERIVFVHGMRPVRFTASLGAVQVDWVSVNTTSMELIARADECLYLAKRDGRNRAVIVF